jgi:hypothetical protein
VTYADDLVILYRKGKAKVQLLGLLVRADVFGENKAYLGFRPSKKSIGQTAETIHALTCPIADMARDRRGGGRAESHAARMGELLPGRRIGLRLSGSMSGM